MSLDVSLYAPANEDGYSVCPHCNGAGKLKDSRVELYDANITHNLNTMAEAAGIYQYLWHPEEVGVTKAAQLIDPLREGLAKLRADPEKFKAYNASNGWGLYEYLVPFVAEYLKACEEHPEADVSVSR